MLNRVRSYRNATGVATLYMVVEPVTAGSATTSTLYSYNIATAVYTAISTSL
jgi:hypothetical protein